MLCVYMYIYIYIYVYIHVLGVYVLQHNIVYCIILHNIIAYYTITYYIKADRMTTCDQRQQVASDQHIYVCIYIYTYTHMLCKYIYISLSLYIYIYIYIYRELLNTLAEFFSGFPSGIIRQHWNDAEKVTVSFQNIIFVFAAQTLAI